MSFRDWMGRQLPEPCRPLAQAITEDVGRPVPQGQAIVENFGGLPRESRTVTPRTVTYMGRQIEVPDSDQWMREHIEQRTREIEETVERYAEGLAAERREAEARAMHHMWIPSDNEANISVLPRWSFERQEHPHLDLSIDPATGEITNHGDTLPDEETLFNPGTLVDTPENSQLTTISDIAPTWELAVSDVMTDKYKEMEKRVEEQDKTIAEMKSIIENLQDIVYQRKLDKEAENLVL